MERPGPPPATARPASSRGAIVVARWVRRWDERPVLAILRRALASYGAHACGIYAGALAFFGLLSLFPLILLLITLLTVLVRASNSTALVLGRITLFFPGSSSLVVGAIDAVTAAQPVLLGVGTLGLLWSSMGVFLTLGYALNRIWEVPGDRPLLVQYAVAAGLALSLGVVVLVSLLLSGIATLLQLLAGALTRVGVPGLNAVTLVGTNVLEVLVVAVAAAVLYRWLPNVRVPWRDVVLPAALMALLWEAARLGFTWYLATFAHVDRLYGPLAAVAGLMLWLFVSSILLLFGAELSHQLARWRAEHAAPLPPDGRRAAR